MKILIIAPHADDETLGMGGTIARLINEDNSVTVAVLTGHGEKPHPLWPKSNWENIRAECKQACDELGVSSLKFYELPAACLDSTPAWQINKVVSNLISDIKPDEIYVPFTYDLHKDHGAINYAVTVATRPYLTGNENLKRVLAYETLSETHLMPAYMTPAFQPNIYIDISNTLETKLRAMQCYKSQLQADNLPRSIAGLRALATLRGNHIGSIAAEGFVLLGEYQR